jgi:hypothetical protein
MGKEVGLNTFPWFSLLAILSELVTKFKRKEKHQASEPSRILIWNWKRKERMCGAGASLLCSLTNRSEQPVKRRVHKVASVAASLKPGKSL